MLETGYKEISRLWKDSQSKWTQRDGANALKCLENPFYVDFSFGLHIPQSNTVKNASCGDGLVLPLYILYGPACHTGWQTLAT